MYSNSKTANAVRLALVFGASATAAISAPAFAAEEDSAEKVERIEVTGSRIKRTDLETASPISVFSSEDIEASGLTTIEDFVQNIPAMNGGALGSSVNNGNPGFATAALRGLGSGRTLLLINGRRFNSNDLNSIPTSFIERVEVVRDGASTVYGSDAIAGVINFITKKDFEGVEVSAQYDITGENDGEQTKFSVTTGASNDKGNVVFSIDYTNRKAIGQGDRKFSECPIWDDGAGSETYCGGSSHSHLGRVNTSDGSFVILDGVPVPYNTAAHGYNYAALSYLVTPQEVFSMNSAANYEISDSMSIFSEASFTGRQSDQLMAPVATFWSAPVPADHPNNIFDEDVSVNRRLTETGGRNFTQDANDYRFVIGLEGEFENGWTWDVAYNYSRFVDARVIAGQINRPRMETLLDPAACAADSACPGIWNPFTTDTLTDEHIAYASVTHSPVRRGTTTQLMANFSGDFGDFELPGGQIMWAAGYEHRQEDYLFQPDGAAAIGQIYFVSGEKTEGDYSVTEAYAEFNFPVLSGAPFAERLNITAAVRSSDYSNQEDTATNTKFGFEWEPVEGLLARASFAEGFRAPSITELFQPQQQSASSYTDPCWGWTENSNATVRANCQADGLSADFTSDKQAAAVTGGNPDLGPEESESLTFGIVYSGIENFTVALDFYDIEITNGIGTAGVDNVAAGCYESEGFSSPLCELIRGNKYGPIDTPPHPTSPRRNVNGVLSGVLLTNANLATFNTSGVDFDFTYNTEIGDGSLTASLNGTWLDEYSYTLIAGGDVAQIAGTVAEDQWEGNPSVFAELKTNLSLTYSTDLFSVNLNTRYMSGGDQYESTPGSNADLLDATADSVVYVDLQGTYYINDTYTVTAGARNLFDKQPPYISTYDDMNTINNSYDLAGQYWYVKATARF